MQLTPAQHEHVLKYFQKLHLGTDLAVSFVRN